MAADRFLRAKEDRRRKNFPGETVDIPFLVLILMLLAVVTLQKKSTRI